MTIINDLSHPRQHGGPVADMTPVIRPLLPPTSAGRSHVREVIALLAAAEELLLEKWSAQLAASSGSLLDALVDSHRSVQRTRIALYAIDT